MLPIAAAYLVAQFIGCILFGLSVATFALAIQSLCDGPFSKLTKVRWALLGVCTAMFVIGAVSVGQMLRHVLNAFVFYDGPGGAAAELNNTRDPMNIVHVSLYNTSSAYPLTFLVNKAITYPTQCLLGDAVLIHRTWMVYSRKFWVIIVPLIFIVADIVAGFGILVAELRLNIGTATDPTVLPWSTSFFGLTLTQNLLCTGRDLLQ